MDYFISDTHFSHENIISYEGRPFSCADEMNTALIKLWNNTVSKVDRVWHLGDFGFGNKKLIADIARQLNGTIFLVLGNHDGTKSPKWWLDCGFSSVTDQSILYQEEFILSHRPMKEVPKGLINIHGHVHTQLDCSNTHFNVSVENIGYKPVTLGHIMNRMGVYNETY